MFDLRDAQQSGYDRQRLIESENGAIDHRLRFLDGACMRATALHAHAHARQRRAQIVGNVVADATNLVNERFNSIEHLVHDGGEPVEWVVDAARRQPLP